MVTLTAADAFKIGKAFLDAHDAVHDYLMSNWNTLPNQDRDRLQSLAVTLYQNASDIVSHGVGVGIDDLKASVNGLASVTNKVGEALKNIQSQKQVINVATSLVALAAAIPTGNIGSIVAAGKQVVAAAAVQGDVKNG